MTYVRRLSPKTPPVNSDERKLNHWFNNAEWESGVSDLWAVPQGEELAVYMAVNRSIFGLTLNDRSVLENRGWRIDGANATVTRARNVVPVTIEGDPDRGAITTGSESGVLYGGLLANADIWTHYEGVLGHVPSPWQTYTGISVDRHYLWVFRSGGFACATHASVIKALKGRAEGKQTSPEWIAHYPNGLLHKGKTFPDTLVSETAGDPPLRGLIDLSACDDGTLTVSVSTRTYNGEGKRTGDTDPCMLTTSYRVDVKAKKIVLDDWTKFHDGNATQVQKLAVHCWPMFDSMRADLSARS